MATTRSTENNSTETRSADRSLFLALALVALCTLFYQVLLTRFLSATVYYHYAFSVIAAAMFGLTFGAVLVALHPRWFPPAGVRTQVSLAALGFSITSVATLAVHLQLCQFMSSQIGPVLVSIFLLAAVPFTCSGIVICLILTRHSRQSGPLYAADLAGSAAGCLLIALLFHFTDGVGALFLGAATATFAGSWPSRGASRMVWRGCLAASFVLFSLAVVQTVLWQRHESLLPITHSKGQRVPQPLFERWNTHSRVTVTPHDDIPFGWGFNPAAVRDRRIEQLYLEMDSNASTIITRFDGNLSTVDFLRHDIVNAGHVLGPGGKVLVIGVGGGRDLLSALVAGRDQVVGVEINPDIIRAITRDFAGFSGHLARHPKVRIEVNDARSFAAGTDESFDMVQVSLVDTWAATAAGALVLTENSLYTLEAWVQFLDRLTEKGVLSFSRWYSPELPYETYRLFHLAVESLRHRGVSEPLEHLVLLTSPPTRPGVPGIATLLASRRPFHAEDIVRLEQYARENGFEVMLAPGSESGRAFRDLLEPEGLQAAERQWQVDLSPPTDDSPFFFEFSHPRDLFSWRLWSGHQAANLEVPRQMLALLILVTALVCLCIIIPLQTRCCDRSSPLIRPGLVFFSAIGFGFMHVEISLIQRLVVLLGNPTQSLTVVLFTLLLASGVGSWFWGRRLVPGDSRAFARFMAALLVSLGIIGMVTPGLVAYCMPAPGMVRIAVSALLVGWAGFLMGGAMPWALQSSAPLGSDTTSWFWGVNGATSVSATVSAVVISLFMGISAAYWTGWAAYVVAALAAWRMLRVSPQVLRISGS